MRAVQLRQAAVAASARGHRAARGRPTHDHLHPRASPFWRRAQWSFATLRYYPVRAIDALCAAAWAQLPSFNAQEITNMIWALARLGHHPGRMLASVDKCIADQAPCMTFQAISNLLWALSVLQARPRRPFGTHLGHHTSCVLSRQVHHRPGATVTFHAISSVG